MGVESPAERTEPKVARKTNLALGIQPSSARCVSPHCALNMTLMQAQYRQGLHRGFRLRNRLTFLWPERVAPYEQANTPDETAKYLENPLER
jgi:hypothetical protein